MANYNTLQRQRPLLPSTEGENNDYLIEKQNVLSTNTESAFNNELEDDSIYIR